MKINTFNTIIIWITRLLLIATFFEALFFYSEENMVGCASMIFGWLLIAGTVSNNDYLNKYPLPVISIFSLGVCYYFLPLIVTLTEFKPLTFNFQNPIETFINQVLFVFMVVCAFHAMRFIYQRDNIVNKILNKVGFMTVPTDSQIWKMGIVGVLCIFIRMFDQGHEAVYKNTGNILEIIIGSLSNLSFAPLCLLFKPLYDNKSKEHTSSKKVVLIYLSVLLILCAATTRRELMFGAFVSIFGVFLFNIFYCNKKILRGKSVAIFILIGYLLVGPLSDIAMAMILNRQMTRTSSAKETFESVMELYNDKEALHNTFQLLLSSTDNGGDNNIGWSEYYVNNIFLDRLCNLRTIDGTIYNAKQFGYDSKEGKDYYINFWINELPASIVNAFNLKKDYLGTAVDHMVVHNFDASRYSLFGFKVGGETGIGLWMFGYFYYILAFFTYILIFYFLSSIVNIYSGSILIPVPILIMFRRYWMFFLNANGIFTTMNNSFARRSLNDIFIYCLLLFMLKFFDRKSAV